MNGVYRHTQTGWTTLGVIGAVALVVLTASGWARAAPTLMFLALVAVLFGSLTVEVDQERIRVLFGPGFISFQFQLTDVTACRPVKNPWIAGWGIRWIGTGWLFNVSGLDAVQLEMKSGKVYRIGTDATEELCEQINVRLTLTL